MHQGHARGRPRRWWLAPLLGLAAALVVWLGIAALSPGYVADIESRKARAKWVTEEGIENAYRMRIDYPPGNLYLFKLVGHVYQATADPRFDRRQAAASQYLTFLVKLPPILFHLATVAAVYVAARRFGERRALLASGLLLFDPAAIWDVAHQGQYDPVHTFFAVLAVLALAARRPAPAGLAIALAAATKPQAWVLVPLVAAYAWRIGGWAGLVRGGLAGAAGLALVLAPFALTNRLHHLLRLPEYMSTNSTANHVISANAHNLWWLPTLLAGRWIDDAEPLVGPLAYRWAGVALVLVVLGWCLWRVLQVGSAEARAQGARQAAPLREGDRQQAPPPHDVSAASLEPDPALMAAVLAAGWFFVTPRAHEYHAFFLLPFLALAWARRPALWRLYPLASLGLLANLALHDPALLGPLAAPLVPESPLPAWLVALQLANVAVLLALFLLLVGVAALDRRARRRPLPGAAPALADA